MVIQSIIDTVQKRRLKIYGERLQAIKAIGLQGWSDKEIERRSRDLKQAVQEGESLDYVLVDAYALAAEAVWRTLGIRLFDVQLIAGIAMHEGHLVEMQTGEGKTLAAVLPAYLNALQGKGMHVLTFNDYLAQRDATWMKPVYSMLGVSIGVVSEGMTPVERQAAYAAEVTYLTAKEAGFDYLRDSLCYDPQALTQRPFHCALIDEADSILIDEARVPLVIAGDIGGETDADSAGKMSAIAKRLIAGVDFDTDTAKRNVYLTESGMDKSEDWLECGNLYDEANAAMLTSLNCALHAEALLRRDVDYIVRDGSVELIDSFTGRIAERRHWPDGLQAAVEAKEGLAVRRGGTVLGSITLQHLLSLYPRMCGMSATALSSAEELRDAYCLEVVVVPPNRPCRRIDYPNAVFAYKAAKQKALMREIAAIHETGRPILIGTASVEESNELAGKLREAGISCHVLNAQHDVREAEIIAQAGALGAVTVSTNMAGRGVDIRLGGANAEAYAEVAALGGLYVIGTNLYESVRINNQLRGRAGRQGDPGASKFFVSLEDELLVRFGIEEALPSQIAGLHNDEPLRSSVVHNRIEHIQRVVSGQNVDIRKTLNKYADMVEQQRRILHAKRTDILTDHIPLTLLAARCKERYRQLSDKFGELALRKAEKRLTLLHLDKLWARHLEYVAFVREGIHLESISNQNPLDAFHRLIVAAFDALLPAIDDAIVQSFQTARLTEDGLDLQQDGLKTPSSTWTYLVNDSFFERRISLF